MKNLKTFHLLAKFNIFPNLVFPAAFRLALFLSKYKHHIKFSYVLCFNMFRLLKQLVIGSCAS